MFLFQMKMSVRVSWICYTSSSMGKEFLNFDLLKIFFVDSWKENQIRISHETEASF